MKSKLNYLIKTSLARKVKSKWFKIANILLAIIIIGVVNIDSIINIFGGDFDKKQKIYIIDNTKETYDVFKTEMLKLTGSKTEEDMKYEIILYDKDKEVEEYLKDNRKDLVIEINSSEENTIDYKLISKEYIALLDSQYLQTALYNTKVNMAILKSNIDTELLTSIYDKAKIERVILDKDKSSKEENMEVIITTVFPVVILPVFMLIIYLIQMVGAEINDEKTTRGMEIIISSVSPTTHLFSKIVAGNLFVIMQALLLFLYSFIGMKIRSLVGGDAITNGVMGYVGGVIDSLNGSTFMSKLVYLLPLTVILLLLTFIIYSLLAGILASMTTNNEDFQQLQTPMIITLLLGYYLAMLAGTFKGSILIRIISYIPCISAILAPSLLVMSEIGIIDVIISIILAIGFIFILIKYGLRIYKVGILNYSSSKLWKKMFKAIKKG